MTPRRALTATQPRRHMRRKRKKNKMMSVRGLFRVAGRVPQEAYEAASWAETFDPGRIGTEMIATAAVDAAYPHVRRAVLKEAAEKLRGEAERAIADPLRQPDEVFWAWADAVKASADFVESLGVSPDEEDETGG